MSRGQRCGNPTAVNLTSLDGNSCFSFKYPLIYDQEAERSQFQTYYSENLVAQGIEPGTSESAAKNSGH
jgi:hypothetical protein